MIPSYVISQLTQIYLNMWTLRMEKLLLKCRGVLNYPEADGIYVGGDIITPSPKSSFPTTVPIQLDPELKEILNFSEQTRKDFKRIYQALVILESACGDYEQIWENCSTTMKNYFHPRISNPNTRTGEVLENKPVMYKQFTDAIALIDYYLGLELLT